MTLGFAEASNDSSLTLKTVFSFGFSCFMQLGKSGDIFQEKHDHTSAGASSAAAAGTAGAAAAEGMAISWMFNLDYANTKFLV